MSCRISKKAVLCVSLEEVQYICTVSEFIAFNYEFNEVKTPLQSSIKAVQVNV